MASTHPAAPAQATRGSDRTWWMAMWRIVLLGLAVFVIALAMWPRGSEATLEQLVDDSPTRTRNKAGRTRSSADATRSST